jgi:hydroxyacylglutathione hydrolase
VIVQTLSVGQLATNCYLVICPDMREAMLIDPAAEAERLLDALEKADARLTTIVNTHGHLDHVLANEAVRAATGAALLMHEADVGMLLRPDPVLAGWLGVRPAFSAPDKTLADGEMVRVGRLSFTALHTPGHTPGGLSLYGHGAVFTGDALFRNGVGRTDLPGGNWKQLEQSIVGKLFGLPDETIVYPGHGPISIIVHERTDNPFL